MIIDDYINLAFFKSMNYQFEPLRNNLLTVSFYSWTDNTLENNMISIIIKDFCMISYTYNGSFIKVYIIIIEEYFDYLNNIKTESDLLSYLTSEHQYAFTEIDVTNYKSNWFYIRGGMSYDKNSAFIYIENDINSMYNSFELKNQILFKSPDIIRTNIAYKKIYRKGEKSEIIIKNTDLLDQNKTTLYIRNLYILRDYISDVSNKFHKYNLHSFVKFTDFPQLVLSIAFDEFNNVPNKYSFKTYEYSKDYLSTPKTSFIHANIKKGVSMPIEFVSPPNFVRLLTLNEHNKAYEDLSYNKTIDLSYNSNQYYVFDNNKAFTCANSKFLNIEDYSCNTDCPSKMTMNPGIYLHSFFNNGICNKDCSSSFECKYLNSDLINLKNTFKCKSDIYTNAYYNCYDKSNDENYALFYSSKYTNANIIFNFSKPLLSSYLMEFWFFMDLSSQYTSYMTSDNYNYVFYSNCCYIYQEYASDILIFGSKDPDNNKGIDNFNKYTWNKLSVSVNQDNKGVQTIELYANFSINSINLGSSNFNQDLHSLLFCHLDPNNCNGFNLNWSSGYYKLLKIWDLNLINYTALLQYNNVYPNFNDSNLSIRSHGLAFYYPLTLNYIKDNVIYDYDYDYNNIDLKTKYNSWNTDNLQIYNYSSNFDYINYNYPSGGYYINSYNRSNLSIDSIKNCDINCKKCWGNKSTECYECYDNYILKYSQCIPAYETYFRSPASTDVVFNTFDNLTPKGTVTFWTKPFGFSNSISNMIYYSDNLKLYYDSTNSTFNNNYGLNLTKVSSSANTLLLNVNDFNKLFGKWILISISYFYDITVDNYFPAMMIFTINGNNYTLNKAAIENFKGLSISNFKIPISYYGLLSNIKAYSDYIINSYILETNLNFTNYIPDYVYLIPGTIYPSTSCIDSNNISPSSIDYKCIKDYDDQIATLPNSNSKCLLKDEAFVPSNSINTSSKCVNNNSCFLGNVLDFDNKINCFCVASLKSQSSDFNSQYITNFLENKCNNSMYLNFSKMSPVIINPVNTAYNTKKYSLQFWIFISSYVPGMFEEVLFAWDYHIKIVINKSMGSYNFLCSFIYDSSDSSYELSVFDTQPFKEDNWQYISCSTDLSISNEYTYYINTENNKKSNKFKDKYPVNFDNNTQSTFIIKDNTTIDDWGIMYLRQIRLWNITFPNLGYMTRVGIITTSLFSNLLHLYDPIDFKFKKIQDLTGNSPDVDLNYSGTLGLNVVRAMKVLNLCQEDTSYYDVNTGKCVNFVNTPNIKNISFPNIYPSYNGNYTLELWIFIEDILSVIDGINIVFTKHLAIVVLTDSTNNKLKAICFPQEYKDNISGIFGKDIIDKINKSYNSNSYILGVNSGSWYWIRCAVSFTDSKYYINTGNVINLKSELLYDSTYESNPYKYFFSNSQREEIIIENINNINKKVYIKYVYAFNNYLPQKYVFNHYDLTNVTINSYPFLLFACNFNNYDSSSNNLSFSIYDKTLDKLIYNSIKLTNIDNNLSNNILANNFEPLHICDPTSNVIYDEINNICVKATCDKTSLAADHCYDNLNPLNCKDYNYMDLYKNDNRYICSSNCSSGYTRSFGYSSTKGICNNNCNTSIVENCANSSISELSNFKNYYKCSSSYLNVNYNCIDKNYINNNVFYYSNCYNSTNYSINFSNNVLSKIQNGYYLEVWFKLDHLNNNKNNNNACHSKYSYHKEYVLYTIPHGVYKDITTNKFYYQLANNMTYTSEIMISEYEWNVVLIKTKIKSRSITVYLNNRIKNSEYFIENIISDIDLNLISIAFCSSTLTENCIVNNININIEWSSCYYKDIRIWNADTVNESIIELFHNSIDSKNQTIKNYSILYDNTLSSLVLHYSFSLNSVTFNIIKNIVDDYDHLNFNDMYTNSSLNNEDKRNMFNISYKFNWNIYNTGKYIESFNINTGEIVSNSCHSNCLNCYSSSFENCYLCKKDFILVDNSCLPSTGYYLKIPNESNILANIPIKIQDDLNNLDITRENSLTITFWVKFIGGLKSDLSNTPSLLEFSNNSAINFNKSSNYIYVQLNGDTAFIDNKFNNDFTIERSNKWIFYSLSLQKSNNYNDYPSLVVFNVMNENILKENSFTIPVTGITISKLEFGHKVLAYFSYLNVYNKFILYPLARFRSEEKLYKTNLILSLTLKGTNNVDCVDQTQITTDINNLNINCVPDINYNDIDENKCNFINNKNNKFLEYNKDYDTYSCNACSNICLFGCVYNKETSCSCDNSEGTYWLRQEKASNNIYCEVFEYTDILSKESIIIRDIKSAVDTNEYSIEFWMYIYSYVPENVSFATLDILWDKHSRIIIKRNVDDLNNLLAVECYPTSSISEETMYKTEKATNYHNYFKWFYVKCGCLRSSFSKTKWFYYLNNTNYSISNPDIFPDITNLSSLNILYPIDSTIDWGFILIKNLSLWKQSTFLLPDVKHIDIINDNSVYPQLLHFFKFNSFDKSSINDEMNNLNEDLYTNQTVKLSKRSDFIGYNIVDPLNINLFNKLTTCEEGHVYNAASNKCELVITDNTLNCNAFSEYTDNLNNKCLRCNNYNNFLHIIDGKCYNTCPEGYFGYFLVDQCRECDSSCNTCNGFKPSDCTSCSGNLNLVPQNNLCIENCEEYNLVKSINLDNMCSIFEAEILFYSSFKSYNTTISLTNKDLNGVLNNNNELKSYELIYDIFLIKPFFNSNNKINQIEDNTLDYNYEHPNNILHLSNVNPKNLTSLNFSIVNNTSDSYKIKIVFNTEETLSYNLLNTFFDKSHINNKGPFDLENLILDNKDINILEYSDNVVHIKQTNANISFPLKSSYFNYGVSYVFDIDLSSIYDTVTTNLNLIYRIVLETSKPPSPGKLTIVPSVGLKNTTYFYIYCGEFKSNTLNNKLDYELTYVEDEYLNNPIIINNYITGLHIEKGMLFNTLNSNKDLSIINVYCKVKDYNEGVYKLNKTISLINQVNSNTKGMFSVKSSLEEYNNLDLEFTWERAKHHSNFLNSLLEQNITDYSNYNNNPIYISTITNIKPSHFIDDYRKVEDINSFSNDYKFIIKDPICYSSYCNYNGSCNLIDMSLVCSCKQGTMGILCNLDNENYSILLESYKKLYNTMLRYVDIYVIELNTNFLISLNNIYKGLTLFEYDAAYMNQAFKEFLNIIKLMNNLSATFYIENNANIYEILNNILKINYAYMNKLKASNYQSNNIKQRNVTLNIPQQLIVKTIMEDTLNNINEYTDLMINKIINNHDNKDKLSSYNLNLEYKYNYEYVNIDIASITPAFNSSLHFKHKINNYRSWIDPVNCLNNYFLSNSVANYNVVLVLIDYTLFPFSYDKDVYANNISPYIDVVIYNSLTGNKITNIDKCNTEETYIKLFIPFYMYGYYLNEINKQINLYNSMNYVPHDSNIFKQPIYIQEETGKISNNTVEERINKFKRNFNITAKYLDVSTNSFKNNGLYYQTLDFKQFKSYFLINSTHLTGFSLFTTVNDVNFLIDGPFFYLNYPRVLLLFENLLSNYAFYVFIFLVCYFLIVLIISIFYDCRYYRQQVLLNFLMKQILFSQWPYEDKNKYDELYERVSEEQKNYKKSDNVNNLFVKGNLIYNYKELNDNSKINSANIINNKSNSNNISAFSSNKLNNNEFIINSYNQNLNNNESKLNNNAKFENNSINTFNLNKNPLKVGGVEDNNYKKNIRKNSLNSKLSSNLSDINNKHINKIKNDIQIDDFNFFDNVINEYNELTNNHPERFYNENAVLKKVNNKDNLTNDVINKNINEDKINVKFNNLFDSSDKAKPNTKIYNYKKQNYFPNINSTSRDINNNGLLNNTVINANISSIFNEIKSIDINNETNPNERKLTKLNRFRQLNISFFKFFKTNMFNRHIFINSITVLSAFHGRLKRCSLMIAQFSLYALLLSIILTIDQTIVISNLITYNLGNLVGYCFGIVFITNIVVYFFAYILYIPYTLQRKLYNTLISGMRMRILRTWNNEFNFCNILKSTTIIILIITIICISFYISVIFNAVWINMSLPWLIGFIICSILDLLILEVLIEVLIAIMYNNRSTYQTSA